MGLHRVLIAHNSYRQRGGEDSVVAAEADLLRARGHEVEMLIRNNQDLQEADAAGKLRAARDCVWSSASAEAMRQTIRRFRPTVVHVHNTLAVLSPSIYWAAAAEGVPVIQTIHNFRLACPQAMYLRDGRICQRCRGRLPVPAVVHACYRNSRTQSLAVAAMLSIHRALGTWTHKIDRYIALSEFCRSELLRIGLPPDKIVVKPNFSPGPVSEARPDAARRADFLFVGRLSQEKGLDVLRQALSELPQARCVVVGEGPQAGALRDLPQVHMTGWLDPAAVSRQMHAARALVVPSIVNEPFALVALEALAHGLPVIASRIGSLPEVVHDQATGVLFAPGDATDLARKMRWVLEHSDEVTAMRKRAQADYAARFSPDVNYRQLIAVYDDARQTTVH